MKARICFGVASVSAVAFFAALCLAYCAGRSGHPAFLGAQVGGFLVGLLGTVILIFLFRRQGELSRVAVCVSIFVLLSILNICGFKVLLRAYAAGFEKTVFSVASPHEWQALVPLAENWMSAHSGQPFDRMLPAFSHRVYPDDFARYSTVTGNLQEPGVAIWWRGPTLCIGLRIGKFEPFTGELYRTQYTNDVSIVIFRGG